MSRLSEAFNKLKKEKRKALITYITAGDPNLSTTEKLIYALEKAGADIVELGVPFSDPLADGPVIQASHFRALKTTVADVFRTVKKVRKSSQIPLVLMLSGNLAVRYGLDKFFRDAENCAVDGVIIPDVPHEEILTKNRGNVDAIFLAAPTSTEERIKKIAQASTGFVYLISLSGITGKRKKISSDLPGMIQKIRKYADKPVAVGFGISNPKQAAYAAKCADGVIVGSAIVEIISKNKKNPILKVSKFVSALRKALDK